MQHKKFRKALRKLVKAYSLNGPITGESGTCSLRPNLAERLRQHRRISRYLSQFPIIRESGTCPLRPNLAYILQQLANPIQRASEYAGVHATPTPEPLQLRKTEKAPTTPSVGVSETLPCGNSTVPSSSTRTHELDSTTQQNQAPGFPSPSEERSGLTNHAPLPPAWKPRNQDPRILRKHSLGAMFRVLLDARSASPARAASSLPPSTIGSQSQNQVLEPLPQCGVMHPAGETLGANSSSQATSGLSDPLWDASPCPHCGQPLTALQEPLFKDVWADFKQDFRRVFTMEELEAILHRLRHHHNASSTSDL